MCVYVTELLIGYIYFCHIYMPNTQHLLQRFLCSGVSLSNYTKNAKPAGSKTQSVNVRLKIFKDVNWCRHPSYHKQSWGVNVTLAAHVSAIITTPVLIKAHSSVHHKGQWTMCWLSDTPGLQSIKGQGEKVMGGLTNWTICWLPVAGSCCW